MKYLEFAEAFSGYPVFSVTEIRKHFPGFDRKVLVNWQQKGYLLKIRNEWYCFASTPKDERWQFLVANRIYQPSYVSLASALAFYRLIPEGVFTVTSVSTSKKMQFETPVGNFLYHKIKPSWFFGYQMVDRQGFAIKIALPEKALLDFVYLYPALQTAEDFSSLRLNFFEMQEIFDWQKMNAWLDFMASSSLKKRVHIIQKLAYDFVGQY